MQNNDLPRSPNPGWTDPDVTRSVDTSSAPGLRIGDYRILRKIGEGGMGVVYEAEQQHPKRLVALKVIRGAGSSSTSM